MKKLYSSAVGIEQGIELLFSDYDVSGTMWTGEGERSRVVKIKFSEKFKSVPCVHISLAMIDVAGSDNHRVHLYVGEVTRSECLIHFKTWGDTRVARASVNWMAIGDAHSETDRLPKDFEV